MSVYTEDQHTRGLLMGANLVGGLALGATPIGFAMGMGIIGGWVGLQVAADGSMRNILRIFEQLSAAAIGFNFSRAMRNDYLENQTMYVRKPKKKKLPDEGDPGQEL